MNQEISTVRERIARLQQYVERDPENVGLLVKLSDAALAAGDLDTARQAICRAQELDSRSPVLSLRASSIALAEGNCEASVEMTGALLDAGHDDAAVVFNHACGLMGVSAFEEAEAALRALDEGGCEYPAIVPMRLRALHYLGDLDTAIARGEAHMAAHQDDGEVAGMLSLLYFDFDALDQARQWSERALALSPESLDGQLVAGYMALADEKASAARDAFHQAVSRHARSGRAWAGLGLAALLEFKIEAARDCLERAVSYMPSHIGTWVTLGWAQLVANDVDAAEQSFTAARDIDDTFAETYGGLAAVAARRGDWEQAEAMSRVGRRLNPRSMAGAVAHIFKTQANGEPGTSVEAIQALLSRGQSPGGGTLLDMIGRLQARQNDVDREKDHG